MKLSLLLSILVVAACLVTGFWIARHRALWTDEFYSQSASIERTSYADQFAGKIPEGGNAPLFYVLQKSFLHSIGYQTPAAWRKGQWATDPLSQILLRVNPIVFMSLSIGLVFFYFCRCYSWPTGLYALFIYLSSYMLWAYWAEARPYALMVFLTTVQSLIFLAGGGWLMLAAVNILLSLTSILSLGQIWAMSALWWTLKDRDWKKYILITILPSVIAVFYYLHAPKYKFYFGLTPEQLVRDNIPRQYFDILFIFSLALPVHLWKQKDRIKDVLPYFVFLVLMLAFTGLLLWDFARHAVTPDKGFAITSRYFIYLMPIGVIATTLCSVAFIGSLKPHRLWQWPFAGLFAFLLLQHFMKIVPKAIHSVLTG